MKKKLWVLLNVLLVCPPAQTGDIDVPLLGGMMRGIVKIKHGVWYDCGKKLTETEQEKHASRIAYKILDRVWREAGMR